MYIRRTTIKSRQTGEPYYTYRLVESIREDGRVRQHTLLNLGRLLVSSGRLDEAESESGTGSKKK